MQKNTLMFLFVAAVVVVGGYFFVTNDTMTEIMTPAPATSQPVAPIAPDVVSPTPTTPIAASKVKEFTMTAYYDEKGKWFSLKEMTVKKGDTVRMSITNTKGVHNFNIDELGIGKDLPLNDVVVVEFTADKAGDFVYYCSIPGHRSGGQWGTLHVIE